MITKSKGNSSWNAAICFATSYCPCESRPHVADHGKSDGAVLPGQGEREGDGRLGRGGCAGGRGRGRDREPARGRRVRPALVHQGRSPARSGAGGRRNPPRPLMPTGPARPDRTVARRRRGDGRGARRRRASPGRWTTPLSIVSPVRLIAWKYRSSPADLHDHEVVVAVEPLGGHVRGADVPLAQPATGAGHPVHDAALLGLDALVDVVVPGEHGAHAVLDEEGLQDRPRFERGAVGLAGRVQG